MTRSELAAQTPEERAERKRVLQNRATRRYQQKNQIILNAKARASRAANPERHREYMRNNRRKNPDKQAAYIRKHRYKKLFQITIEEYNAMEIVQGGRCGICRRDKPGGRGRWHIDHCHRTGRVRKLLCTHCNTGLGRFYDDPDLLQRAIDYLNLFQATS